MTRMLLPLPVADISSFAKNLKKHLDERQAEGKFAPTHVELLNLLARAAGLRNFQTLKATSSALPPQPTPHLLAELTNDGTGDFLPGDATQKPMDLSILSPTARKALMQFDTAGRLIRLPNKLSVQQMAMWWMWTRFSVRRKYTEREVNQVLNAHHTFGDPATLRRELVNMKLLGRKPDCSEYWKEPMRPNADIQLYLRALRQAVAASQPLRAMTALNAQRALQGHTHASA